MSYKKIILAVVSIVIVLGFSMLVLKLKKDVSVAPPTIQRQEALEQVAIPIPVPGAIQKEVSMKIMNKQEIADFLGTLPTNVRRNLLMETK